MNEQETLDAPRNTNPYVGPRSFQESDRERFFGREKEARDLLAHVLGDRLVVFYAQSGAGKTSLINARLIPDLRSEGFDILPVGRVAGTIPDGVQPRNPFSFNLLSRLSARNPELADRPELLHELAQLTVAQFFGATTTVDEASSATAYDSVPTLLVIDQFEEVFTSFEEDEQARSDFFRQLRDAQVTFPRLWVLLAMREELIAHLDTVAYLMPNRLERRFYMQRMGVAAAKDAITEPARLAGTPFTDDAGEELVNELRALNVQTGSPTATVGRGRYIEPVQLQVVCFTLWEHLPTHIPRITESHVKEFGNVDRALSEFYESTLRIASRDARVRKGRLRSWFEHKLITAGGTRGFVYRGQRETEQLPNRAVDVLGREHLIRSELRAGAVWIELTHDRMIEPIKASNAEANRRSLTRLIAVVGAAGLVVVLFSLSTVYNTRQDVSAIAATATVGATQAIGSAADAAAAAQQSFVQQRQRESGARSGGTPATPAQTQGPLPIDTVPPAPQPSPLPAATPTSAAGTALPSATTLPATATPAPSPTAVGAVPPQVWNQGYAFEASKIDAYWVDYNSNTRRAVTAGADRTVRIWTNPTSTPPDLLKQWSPGQGSVYTATFSPQGDRLFVGGVGPLAEMYDGEGNGPLLALRGHTNDVIAAAFNEDGSLLATGSFDFSAIIWNLNGGTVRRRLSAHNDVVSSVAFRKRLSDGEPDLLATGSWDGTAVLWDVDSGRQVTRLPTGDQPGPGGKVWSVAFSPDGKRLLTGSDDGIIRSWNVKTGAPIEEWWQHTAATTSLTFSPDSKRPDSQHAHLLSTSGDASAVVWDVASKTPSEPLRVGNAIVWSGAFVDEHWLLTSDAMGNIRVWRNEANAP